MFVNLLVPLTYQEGTSPTENDTDKDDNKIVKLCEVCIGEIGTSFLYFQVEENIVQLIILCHRGKVDAGAPPPPRPPVGFKRNSDG